MGIHTFCELNSPVANNHTASIASIQPADASILELKSTFRSVMIVISVMGVVGNVLNLMTLRSPSLHTVPFLFIRALAAFDLIGLSTILLHFCLEIAHVDWAPVIYYEIWVEDVVINSFLVAGLYVAVLLTMERFMLIRRPYLKLSNPRISIENVVLAKIALVLFASILLHCPMALQNAPKLNPKTGRLVKGTNQQWLCHEPNWTLFNYYKMAREFLRFFCVALLISMNVVIAKALQVAKRNRRLLIKRPSMAEHAAAHEALEASSSAPNQVGAEIGGVGGRSSKSSASGRRDPFNLLMRSFTEKKLTALMAAICLIYAVGNVPQMVVMMVQNEALEGRYGFQLFRNIANTLEVLNHCLNFFIFCMASSEYMRAFLVTNCRCVRPWLMRFPVCAAFIHARRLNSAFDIQYSRHGVIMGDLPSNCASEGNGGAVGCTGGVPGGDSLSLGALTSLGAVGAGGRRRSKYSTASMMNLPTITADAYPTTVAQKKLSSCLPTPGESEAIVYRHKFSSASTTASPTMAMRVQLLGGGVGGERSVTTSLSSSMITLTAAAAVQSPLRRPIIATVITTGGGGSASSREESIQDEFL